MKGLFIPGITTKIFRNVCLESIEALMAEGEFYDIEYDPKTGTEYKGKNIEESALKTADNTVSEKDVIYRQAAIEKFEPWLKVDGYSEGELNMLKAVLYELRFLPSAQPEPKWIPCSEGLPECEQEVLICTKKKVVGKDAYIDSIVTPALYEDGTMLEVNSKWRWEDIDYAGWDEEEDCGIIPEGWWENRHFNPDEVYNNPVDREVVAWMPLPKPYRVGGEEE